MAGRALGGSSAEVGGALGGGSAEVDVGGCDVVPALDETLPAGRQERVAGPHVRSLDRVHHVPRSHDV